MLNVHLAPWFSDPDRGDGGIRRVWEAQVKHLPKFGVKPVQSPDEAQVIGVHGADIVTRPGIPVAHHSHGLYWSRQGWGSNFQEVNQRVIDAMCIAEAHTVPSEWVATAVRRGGLFYPEVVYHGIDAHEWKPPEKEELENYVLWNKARFDPVSDPMDMNNVAKLTPNRPYLATLHVENFKRAHMNTGWKDLANIRCEKPMPFKDMKYFIQHAGVYLATARETFGIGTLEALACGVPVAGWDWGGQSEIIIPGETGYLAPPGDFHALADCIEKCFEHRERMSIAARQDILLRWGWEQRIQQYADIYKRVNKKFSKKRPKVSVLITAYNLDKYLPDCIQSVQQQTLDDIEIIVIDDAQSDTTKKIVEDYAKDDKRIKYEPTPKNMGLPGARNYGASIANSLYIRNLDADDMLTTNALEIESGALDQDPGIHIVYGHLQSINEDGTIVLDEHGEPRRGDWPPKQFSWRQQMAHMNQLPSCSMMRSKVVELSGGYRERMKRNEDAEFWCRTTSLGFRAKKVTEAVTELHRHREDSKGAVEWATTGGEPDWTAWFPWRLGATNVGDGWKAYRKHAKGHPNHELVPFGAQGKPIEGRHSWYIHDYAYPVVSVIVTVGPGHEKYLLNALDSVLGQTYPDWECIVVNDTGKDWDEHIMGAPWAKVVNCGGNYGISHARNVGFEYAKGRYLAWLDVDDIWLPWFLEKTVAMCEQNDGIIYTDILHGVGSELEEYKYVDFKCKRAVKGMQYPGSSILIPRWVHEKVVEHQGGYDEDIPGWEDRDYQIACHVIAGACAYHIPEPCFIYSKESGNNRKKDEKLIKEIVSFLDEKWYDYRKGGREYMCGCSKPRRPVKKPVSTLSSSGNFVPAVEDNVEVATKAVVMEYVGPRKEKFSLRSQVDRRKMYTFANIPHHNKKVVFQGDVDWLISQTDGEGKPTFRVEQPENERPAELNPQGFVQ